MRSLIQSLYQLRQKALALNIYRLSVYDDAISLERLVSTTDYVRVAVRNNSTMVYSM